MVPFLADTVGTAEIQRAPPQLQMDKRKRFLPSQGEPDRPDDSRCVLS